MQCPWISGFVLESFLEIYLDMYSATVTFYAATIVSSFSHCLRLHQGKMSAHTPHAVLLLTHPKLASSTGQDEARELEWKGGESIRLGLRHLQLAGYPGMEHLSHETIWFLAQTAELWPHLLGL